MRRTMMAALAALAAVACGDTDVANRGGEPAAEQRIEDSGRELDVQPVDIEATAWFREGRSIEFNNRRWVLAGEPVFDPAVERVGEFEGTPLYSEVNVSPPYSELYIPLDNDYWQRLEAGPQEPAAPADDTATAGRTGA